MPIATMSIKRIISVSQVGTLPDSFSAACGSVGVVASLGVAVDGSLVAVSLGSAEAGSVGDPVALDEPGDDAGTLELGEVVGEVVDAVVDAVVGVGEGADEVGAVADVRVGRGVLVLVGVFVGVGVGWVVGVGLGAARTGAATPGARRAAPCCQASATAPPSGTSSEVAPSVA